MKNWIDTLKKNHTPLPQTLGWLLLGAFFLLLDQASKYYALHHLEAGRLYHSFFGLEFFLTYNRGVAFSFLAHQGLWVSSFLLSIALFVSLILIYFVSKKSELLIHKLAFMYILGGALGNAYDRIKIGSVIDFITLKIGPFHWPTIFNVGDIFITVGCLLLLYSMIFRKS